MLMDDGHKNKGKKPKNRKKNNSTTQSILRCVCYVQLVKSKAQRRKSTAFLAVLNDEISANEENNK